MYKERKMLAGEGTVVLRPEEFGWLAGSSAVLMAQQKIHYKLMYVLT